MSSYRGSPRDYIDFYQPIAIVGMGCVFPGAQSYTQFWENNLQKKCFIRAIDRPESGIPEVYDPRGQRPNKTMTNLGGTIEPFDFPYTRFKGIMPLSISKGDYYLQYTLLAAQDAIDDAGTKALFGQNDKTFLAIGHYNYESRAVRDYADRSLEVYWRDIKQAQSYQSLSTELRAKIDDSLEERFFKSKEPLSVDTLLAGMATSAAARICKFNRFNGGYATVDAACGSSFAALEVAMHRLRDHSSNVCLVGGVGVISPYFYIQCSQAGTLSQQGCFPFDTRASGFVVGEGAGFVVLKRLPDAIKNGDRIHAVVRGIGSSSDGSKGGLWAPNREGQKRAIKRALKQCDHKFSQLDFIECHGTGTKVGDLEELSTLMDLATEAGMETPVAIGSVKGSIGHLLPGAGMAGLIRTVLALKHRVIPSTVGHESPTTGMQSINSKFFVPDKASPFGPRSQDGVPRAMINSFGFGGVNFNVQVEAFHEPYHKQWAQDKRSSKGIKQIFPVQKSACANSALMPIAVVGMDVLVPGAYNLEQWHHNLLNKHKAIGKSPEGRFTASFINKRDQFAAEKKLGDANIEAGYLDWTPPTDHTRWKIPPKDAKDVDPNQFRLFKVVEESLKQARLLQRKDLLKDCALLSGVMIDSEFYSKAESSIRLLVLLDQVEDLVREHLRHNQDGDKGPQYFEKLRQDMMDQVADEIYFVSQNSAVAGIDSILGSRTAKIFDLQGGSYAFDAVCASGLLQIDHALRLLRSGEKSAVVVASSTMAMHPAILDCYNKLTGGWVNGVSKPFDRDRNAFTLGEGAASVVLMRMDDAIKYGIDIISLIHSSGVSSDGTTTQMLQPSQETFQLAVREAYEKLGSVPPDIGYIATNGLGTPMSDAAEMQTYGDIYAKSQPNPVVLTGIKGAIGHLKVVSGLVNMVSACLALQNKIQYPTVGCNKPDPMLKDKNLRVLQEPESIDVRNRFVGVTTIGLGGINAHLVLSNFNSDWKNSEAHDFGSVKVSQTISGSPEERGRSLGKRWKQDFGDKFQALLQSSEDAPYLKLTKPDLNEFKSFLSSDYKQELEAFSKEIGVDTDKVIEVQAMMQSWITQFGACLGFTAKDSKGERFHAGTLDIPMLDSKSVKQVSNSVFIMKPSGCLSYQGIHFWGSVFPMAGINEAGISVSLCTGSVVQTMQASGKPFGIFARELLESARTLDDVLALAQKTHLKGSWIFLIHSAEEKKSLLLEMAGNQLEYRLGDLFECTNHFQFLRGDRDRNDSVVRLNRLKKLTAEPLDDWMEALKILGDQYDGEREKVTRWPTANTLNRYNSAVSFLFRVDHQQALVSMGQSPSGSGPYQSYALAQSKPEIGSQFPKAKVKISRWLETIGEGNDTLPWHSGDDVTTISTQAKKNKVVIWKTHEDLKSFTFDSSDSLVLIDQLGFDDSSEENLLELFYQKVFIIKKWIEKGVRIHQVQLWGQDDYPSSREQSSKISMLFQISRAFYRSLNEEKVINDGYFLRVPDQQMKSRFLVDHHRIEAGQLLNSSMKDWYCSYQKVFPVIKIKRPLCEVDEISSLIPKTVLITGGLGDLGFELAKALGKKYPQAKCLILGRTSIDGKEQVLLSKSEFINSELQRDPQISLKALGRIWTQMEKKHLYLKRFEALRNDFPAVEYHALDLCDANAVAEKFRELRKNYEGFDRIYHAAGLDISKLFQDKDEADFRKVVDTKIHGSLNLFRSLQKYFASESIKEFHLFSSITAEIGNRGQSDYAAANAFYKSFAVKIKASFPEARIRNILWPAWDEVGMATRGIKGILLQRGFKFISLSDGLDYLLGFSNESDQYYDLVTASEKDIVTSRIEFVEAGMDIASLVAVEIGESKKATAIVPPETFSEVWHQHHVQGAPVLPGVFWVDIMAQWARRTLGEKSITADKISFLRAMRTVRNFQPILRLESVQRQNLHITGRAARLSRAGAVLNPAELYVEGTFHRLDSKLRSEESFVQKDLTWEEARGLYQDLNRRFHGHLTDDFQKIKKYSILSSEKLVLWVEREKHEADGYVLDSMNQGVVGFPELSTLPSFSFLPHEIEGLNWFHPFTEIQRFLVIINKRQFTFTHLEFSVAFYDGATCQLLLTIEKLRHQTTNVTLLKGDQLWN